MDDGSDYLYLYDDEEFVETDRPGFRRRIVNGDGMQLCFWRISGGAKGSFMHNHEEHEQLGIVIRGGLELRIGDSDTGERRVLGPGTSISPRGGSGTGTASLLAMKSMGSAGSLTSSPHPATT